METKFLIILICFSISLASFRVAFGLSDEVDLKNNDEASAFSINTPSNEITGLPNNLPILENNIFIARADESIHAKIDSLKQEVIAPNATTTLPKNIFICRNDEAVQLDLTLPEIDDNIVDNRKVPVLFVPGLLGTEIFENNELVWLSIGKLFFSSSDNFLDNLAIYNNFKSSDNLLVGEVIGKKIIPLYQDYDYMESLTTEFQNKGYSTDNNQENQNFFTFPYDWRYGVTGKNPNNKTNSELLKERIDKLAQNSPNGKVHIIAHSLGGLIAKKYIIDNPDSKIGKMIFVGVPNLGSPHAVKTLLSGNDFKIPGLNPEEMRKISYNMPAAYDLLPGKNYYERLGSYLGLLTQSSDMAHMDYRTLNHEDSQLYLNSHLNQNGLAASRDLRTEEFDFYDVRPRVSEAYNIMGCKTGTLLYASGNTPGLPVSAQPQPIISGDDTVPLESGNSLPIDDNKAFYLPLAEHGKMPSNESIRKMILSIIEGTPVPPKIISRATLRSDASLCRLDGASYEVKSPLDIAIADQTGKVLLGIDGDGNTRYEIPGARYENINGHKYVYLPSEYDGLYDISLKGAGTGTFTLIRQEIKNGQAGPAKVFNDIPVTPEFAGKIETSGGTVAIIKNDQTVINPTSQTNPEVSGDIIAPQTEATVNGQAAKTYYNSEIKIELAARDFAQDGVVPAGVFSTSFSLDGAATTTVNYASTTISVAQEGRHRLVFYAADKLGNREAPKTVEFVIDKTAPEIKIEFSPAAKDLVFGASDNFSAPEKIVITDQKGLVAAVDESGNAAKLSFKEKDRKSLWRAQLLSLAYNGREVSMAGARLSFAWSYGFTPNFSTPANGLMPLPPLPKSLPKTGALSFLLQQARLKNGSYVVAVYSNGRTAILEYRDKKIVRKTVSGLRLIEFATQKGGFSWSY